MNFQLSSVKIKFRDLENLCDVILTKILSCPNCDEMLEMHKYYFRKINDALGTKKDEIDAVRDFEEHLNNRGFKSDIPQVWEFLQKYYIYLQKSSYKYQLKKILGKKFLLKIS